MWYILYPCFMTHADLINLWPSLGAFAGDIAVEYETAKAMRRRSSIPSGYWKIMTDRARDRALVGVTLEALAIAAALPRHDTVPASEAAE